MVTPSKMEFVELELPCKKSSPLVPSVDPVPNWTLDDLLSELKALEQQLGYNAEPSPLKQPPNWEFPGREEMNSSNGKLFVMRAPDIYFEDSESEDEAELDRRLVTGTRFSCNDLDLSESEGSDDELHSEASQSFLMAKRSLEEGILFELECEHQLKVKEEIRSKLAALEACQMNEIERLASAMDRIGKYIEVRQEMDRRLDKQYQRKIAEVLDNHLSAIQRDHEQRSQIEERRIRDDAALEETKRKEKALREEKLRREAAKAEAEARLKAAKLAEEASKAALEAAQRASKEAEEKKAAQFIQKNSGASVQNEALEPKRITSFERQREAKEEKSVSDKMGSNVPKAQSKGIKVLASDAALKAEASRLKMYNEVAEKTHHFAQKDLFKYGRKIFRQLQQATGVQDAIREKAHTLINIINSPEYPHSISILSFAKQVVALCELSEIERIAFPCSRIILLVISQVPTAMDFVLAEFHRACIYTVPKHLQRINSAYDTEEYWEMLGYRKDENGDLESSESYLARVGSYMTLYAALLQTEVEGIRNPFGLREGWAWLARFLNAIPANRATAAALGAFLKMAGFAMFRRYRSQFHKLLNIVSRDFLPSLKAKGYQGMSVARLEEYLENKGYLQEPEGWRLKNSLLSNEFC